MSVRPRPEGLLEPRRPGGNGEYRKTTDAEDVTTAEPLSDGGYRDFSDIDPDSGVKRGLKTRHLSMMALAGIIGPGLLIGSGGALASGGPAALIIGFGVIGIVAFSIMQSLGELTTLYPTGGAFTSLSSRFVDKAFGVAVGWNYYIIWWAVLSNEYNVICSIFNLWGSQVPIWGYFLIFWVCCVRHFKSRKACAQRPLTET